MTVAGPRDHLAGVKGWASNLPCNLLARLPLRLPPACPVALGIPENRQTRLSPQLQKALDFPWDWGQFCGLWRGHF